MIETHKITSQWPSVQGSSSISDGTPFKTTIDDGHNPKFSIVKEVNLLIIRHCEYLLVIWSDAINIITTISIAVSTSAIVFFTQQHPQKS